MPTDALVEYAQVPAFKLVMETDMGELADLIEAHAKVLLKFGITVIHDTGVTPAAEVAHNKLHD